MTQLGTRRNNMAYTKSTLEKPIKKVTLPRSLQKQQRSGVLFNR